MTKSIASLLLVGACARPSPPPPVEPVEVEPARPLGRVEADLVARQPPAFEHVSTESIAQLPKKRSEVKLKCPAASVGLASGDVVLAVDVRKTGVVREVRVVKGIGHGCDEVAVRALSRFEFTPAIGTNGKPVDYTIGHYVYTFVASDDPLTAKVWARWYGAELKRRMETCRPADEWYRCLCVIACAYTPEVAPPEGDVVISYPYVEVDGLEIAVPKEGPPTRCGHARAGDPSQTFEMSCSAP